jgi:hypothetical protein
VVGFGASVGLAGALLGEAAGGDPQAVNRASAAMEPTRCMSARREIGCDIGWSLSCA